MKMHQREKTASRSIHNRQPILTTAAVPRSRPRMEAVSFSLSVRRSNRKPRMRKRRKRTVVEDHRLLRKTIATAIVPHSIMTMKTPRRKSSGRPCCSGTLQNSTECSRTMSLPKIIHLLRCRHLVRRAIAAAVAPAALVQTRIAAKVATPSIIFRSLRLIIRPLLTPLHLLP